MSELFRLEDVKRLNQHNKNPTFFNRSELNQLLSLYSRRVSSGEWRDYAIDQRAGMAVFSVFRHTHDCPLFSITKRGAAPGRAGDYVVFAGHEKLKRARSISEALTVFERRLKLVSTNPH